MLLARAKRLYRNLQSGKEHVPWPLLAMALCVGAFCWSVSLREGWLLDDALIFQNHVRNIAGGTTAGYSHLGPPVEGHSSPLWVMLLVLLHWLGMGGFLAAKAFGALLAAVSVAVVTWGPRGTLSAGHRLVVGLTYALLPALAWWSATGMETPLLILLMSLAAVGIFNRAHGLVAVVGGLLAISRPEGVVYAGAVGLWLSWEFLEFRWGWRRVARYLALLALPLALVLLHRYLTFEAWIGNAGYAKLGNPPSVGSTRISGLVNRFDAAWAYLLHAMSQHIAVWALAFVATLMACVYGRFRRDRSIGFALILAVVVFYIGVAGADWMPLSRFALPLAPVFAVASLAGLDAARRAGAIWWPRVGLLGCVVALVLSFHLQHTELKVDHSFVDGTYLTAKWPERRRPFLDPLRVDWLGALYAWQLMRHTEPGDTVVHCDVGQSGYLVHDVHLIDQFGLVSRPEADYLNGKVSAEDLQARVAEARPSVVFLPVDPETDLPAMRVGRQIWAGLDPAEYQVVQRAEIWGGYVMKALVRKDRLHATFDLSRIEKLRDASPGLLWPFVWNELAGL